MGLSQHNLIPQVTRKPDENLEITVGIKQVICVIQVKT